MQMNAPSMTRVYRETVKVGHTRGLENLTLTVITLILKRQNYNPHASERICREMRYSLLLLSLTSHRRKFHHKAVFSETYFFKCLQHVNKELLMSKTINAHVLLNLISLRENAHKT